MTISNVMGKRCLPAILGILLAGSLATAIAAEKTNASEKTSAAALRTKYSELSEQLANNQFKRPLYMESTESSSTLEGDIYAKLDYPFATVNAALNDPAKAPANWCNVLILHLNTKYCYATAQQTGDQQAGKQAILKVNIGKKVEQSLNDAYRVEFDYRAVATTPDYFQVELYSEKGPLSTSDYSILVEAVAIDAGHTFLHLTYSYSYGMAGRLAMKTYLATIARDKVGFTVTGNATPPKYIGGVRGVVERNTMRYYLAIDAYLSAVGVHPSNQLEKRLQNWFSGTEQYALQLHEVERNEYIDMKYKEYQRQQTAQ